MKCTTCGSKVTCPICDKEMSLPQLMIHAFITQEHQKRGDFRTLARYIDKVQGNTAPEAKSDEALVS